MTGPEAQVSRVIENPATGERIRILAAADETAGQLLAFELELRAGGRGPAPHRHPAQEERFTVLEGRLRIRVGLRSCLLGAGDTAAIRSGTPHSFVNPGPGSCRVRVEVRPALRMAELLSASASLGTVPGPVALAHFLCDFAPEVRSPVLPRTVGAAASVLAWMASRRVTSKGRSKTF